MGEYIETQNKRSLSLHVAIIGLACRLPGDEGNPEAFWNFLVDKKSAYTDVSKRWNPKGFYHPSKARLNASVAQGGHFLNQNLSEFDPAFFSISYKEAMAMDPQQRLMLEVSYEALENAGIPMETLAGSKTACYVGNTHSDWREMQFRDPESAAFHTATASSAEFISNRVSWFYDLKGPSMTVDTACSSSLVALHLAVQSIQNGESSMAIVGGTNLLLNPEYFTYLSNQGFLSPDGRCKSFDTAADGYGRGEGCAALILKPLETAISDGDAIRSVILGTGVNQDGRTKGITMPSTIAQMDLIKSVYETAGIDMQDTQYVEAHGTGTQAGDPIELEAISRTIGSARRTKRRDKLFVGSVKPNIGHLEAMAGLAGVIKGILSLEHEIIPPNILFTTPNPRIPLDSWHLQIPVSAVTWPREKIRRVSVNSFGAGGTNAHVVMEAASSYLYRLGTSPNDINNSSCEKRNRIFVFSSASREALERLRIQIATYLERSAHRITSAEQEQKFLNSLSFTINDRRSRLPWISYVVGSTIRELRDTLDRNFENVIRRAKSPAPICFVFTGQGAQWARMGAELYRFRVFRESITAADTYLRALGCPWSVDEELKREEENSQINLPAYSQPLCTVLQVALVDLLASWDICPSSVIGHSSGEIGAAYCLGAFTREQAYKIAYWRGVCSAQIAVVNPALKGAMLAVGLSKTEVQDFINGVSSGIVVVACVNSPSSVTLSGDPEPLKEIQARLQEKRIFARMLKVETAYHSPHMETIASSYLECISDIDSDITRCRANNSCTMYSSVFGGRVDTDELGSMYWVRNLVSPVLFSDAVTAIVADYQASYQITPIMVEIGPHPALKGPVKQILGDTDASNFQYLSTISRGQNTDHGLLSCATTLLAAGHDLRICTINSDDPLHDVHPNLLTDVPSYPWDHSQAYWNESRLNREYRQRGYQRRSLIGAPLPNLGPSLHLWRGYLRVVEEPWIQDYKIGDSIYYPVSGLICMAIEGARQIGEKKSPISSFTLTRIRVHNLPLMYETSNLEAILEIRPASDSQNDYEHTGMLEFSISTCDDDANLAQACSGLVSMTYEAGNSEELLEHPSTIDMKRFPQGQKESTDFYSCLKQDGLHLGPSFQSLHNLKQGSQSAYSEIQIPQPTSTFISTDLERPHIVHPTTLEPAFHTIWACLENCRYGNFTNQSLISIDRLILSTRLPYRPGSQLRLITSMTERDTEFIISDITVLSDDCDGQVAVIKGVRIQCHISQQADLLPQRNLCSTMINKPAIDLLSTECLKTYLEDRIEDPIEKFCELIELFAHSNPVIKILEIGTPDDPSRLLPLFKSSTSSIEWSIAFTDSVTAADVERIITEYSSQGVVQKVDLDLALESPCAYKNFDFIIDFTEYLDSGLSQARIQALKSILSAKGRIFLAGANNKTDLNLESTISHISITLDTALETILNKPVLMNISATKSTVPDDSGYSAGADEVVFIIEPSNASRVAREFAINVKTYLESKFSLSPRIVTWDTHQSDDIKGSKILMLVELESSLLWDLSASGFHSIQQLVMKSSHLVWVTALHDPADALFTGLGRTIRNEIAGKVVKTLQLTSSLHEDALVSLVSKVFCIPTSDHEYIEHNKMLTVNRLVEDTVQSNHADKFIKQTAVPVPLTDISRRHKLTMSDTRLPSSIGFETIIDDLEMDDEEDLIEADHIEIEVRATTISNLQTTFCLKSGDFSPQLGIQGSGIVTRTGFNVSKVQIGDSVMFLAPEGIRQRYVRESQNLAEKIPPGISYKQAASMPLAYCAAYHALINVARLEQGNAVLIHADDSTFAQAVRHLAEIMDMVIFIVQHQQIQDEPSGEKCDLSTDSPALFVLNAANPRGPRFVLEQSHGEGVDCIIYCDQSNIISNQMTLWPVSDLLRPFGTIFSIPSRTSSQTAVLPPESNNRLNTSLNNYTFVSAAIEDILIQQPDYVSRLFSDTAQLLRQTKVQLTTTSTVYPISNLHDALDTLHASRQHPNSMVITFDSTTAPLSYRQNKLLKLDSHATYLVVGGLGGLGRSILELLVSNGARNICVLSRSGAKSQVAQETIERLSHKVDNIKVFVCDISDGKQVNETLSICRKELPPIKGVIQGAMVLRDVPFERMTHEDWRQCTLPKVQGSWNLHQLLRKEETSDFFIMLSSISGVFGNQGQGNYAAANAYQDALAIYRREHDKTAVALDVGIMRGVGVLAEQGAKGNTQEWVEPFGILEKEFHALLQSVIVGSRNHSVPAQVVTGMPTGGMVVNAGIKRPFFFQDVRFAAMWHSGLSHTEPRSIEEDKTVSTASKSFEEEASAITKLSDAISLVLSWIITHVARQFRRSVEDIDPSYPLYSFGIDSLAAIEMRNWVWDEMKADVELLDFLSGMSIQGLAQNIAGRSKLFRIS